MLKAIHTYYNNIYFLALLRGTEKHPFVVKVLQILLCKCKIPFLELLAGL